MARRRKRIRQICEQEGTRGGAGEIWRPKGGQPGPPGAGGNEDVGSPVTRAGTSGTGVGCATERAPALSRPQVNRPGRGGAVMAQRAHEQGADDARQEEGAAKRNREAHADTLQRRKGCEDKDETVKYVPRGSLGKVNSTHRRGRRRGAASTPQGKDYSTRRARELRHRGNHQVRSAGRGGTRRQGWGLELDAMYAERCPARLSRSHASRRQRRQRRHRGPCGGTGGRCWWG